MCLLDPPRRRLLAALDEPRSASGLARLLGLRRQTVNYHVTALVTVGLARVAGEGARYESLYVAMARRFVVAPSVWGGIGGEAPQSPADAALVSAIGAAEDLCAVVRAGKRGSAVMPFAAVLHFPSGGEEREFKRDLMSALETLAASHRRHAGTGRRFELSAVMYPKG